MRHCAVCESQEPFIQELAIHIRNKVRVFFIACCRGTSLQLGCAQGEVSANALISRRPKALKIASCPKRETKTSSSSLYMMHYYKVVSNSHARCFDAKSARLYHASERRLTHGSRSLFEHFQVIHLGPPEELHAGEPQRRHFFSAPSCEAFSDLRSNLKLPPAKSQ